MRAPEDGREGGRRELRPQSAASEIKGPLHSRDVSDPEGATGSATLNQRPDSEPGLFCVPRTRACSGHRAAGTSACGSAVRVSVVFSRMGVSRACGAEDTHSPEFGYRVEEDELGQVTQPG